MHVIRVALVISAVLAVGACGGASDRDSGLGDIGQASSVAESELRPGGTVEAAQVDDSPRVASRGIQSPAVTTTTGTGVSASETSTTTTPVETIDLAPVFDALEALDGLFVQLDTEIESFELEEEGVVHP